jgi:hypothetical protein
MTRLNIYTIALVVAFCLVAMAAPGADVDPPAVEWESTIGPELFGWKGQEMSVYDFQQTMDGGYIVVGTGGLYLVKLDPQGKTEWARAYDFDASASYMKAVYEKPNGCFVVTYARNDATGSTMAPGLMETDPMGKLIWSKVLGSGKVVVNSMVATNDGGYVLAGGIIVNWIANSMVIKTDSAGEVVYSKVYAGGCEGLYDCFHSVDKTLDGGLILGGYAETGECCCGGIVACYVVKTDAQGQEEWFKLLLPPPDSGTGWKARECAGGGYVASGGRGVWVFKTDASGNEEWSRQLGPEGKSSFGRDVRQTCDGGYIAAGELDGKPYVVRVMGDGEEMWSVVHTPSGGSGIYASVVRQTRDGGYMIAGDTTVPGRPRIIFLAKLAPDGDCKPQNSLFRRGDSDADGALQLTDAVFTLNHLFLAGPRPSCLDAADADDNGAIQITDAILTLNHMFLGGQGLPGPFGSCGSDTTADELGCAAFPACQ